MKNVKSTQRAILLSFLLVSLPSLFSQQVYAMEEKPTEVKIKLVLPPNTPGGDHRVTEFTVVKTQRD